MTISLRTMATAALTLVLSAPAASSHAGDQAPPPVDQSVFRSVWVAGFVAADRPDFDLNGALVREIRSALRSQSMARVVDAAAVRLREDSELVRRDDYLVTVEEHGYPLVVTGTVSFNYPVERRRTHRPGRHVDVHPTVTLKIELEFIDSASGARVAAATIPSQRLVVSHGRPGVDVAFDMVFSKAKAALLESIVRGPAGIRWSLR